MPSLFPLPVTGNYEQSRSRRSVATAKPIDNTNGIRRSRLRVLGRVSSRDFRWSPIAARLWSGTDPVAERQGHQFDRVFRCPELRSVENTAAASDNSLVLAADASAFAKKSG